MNLETYFNNRDALTDFSIINIDNNDDTLSLHKCVLATNSKYFHAFFSKHSALASSSCDEQQRVGKFPGFSFDAIKFLLSMFYRVKQNTNIPLDFAFELIKLADYFQVSDDIINKIKRMQPSAENLILLVRCRSILNQDNLDKYFPGHRDWYTSGILNTEHILKAARLLDKSEIEGFVDTLKDIKVSERNCLETLDCGGGTADVILAHTSSEPGLLPKRRYRD